jgi:hypothetical protein
MPGWSVSDLPLAVGIAAAWATLGLMGVRLTRGDRVLVDGSIALVATVLLPVPVLAVSVLVGTSVAIVLRSLVSRDFLGSSPLLFRRVFLAVGLAVGISAWTPAPDIDGVTRAFILFLFGTAHALADLGILALETSVRRRQGLVGAVTALGSSLITLHAAHVSLGVAAVLLYDRIGFWSIVVLTPLILLIQYSFNLLLRIKAAYRQTIEALVHASELQLPEPERGHAQRVADTAVAIGRRLALEPARIELLNYSALLHEIGRIGDDESPVAETDVIKCAEEGAAIVESIPFLAEAAPILRLQPFAQDAPESADPLDLQCARLVRVACLLDRIDQGLAAGTDVARYAGELERVLDVSGDDGEFKRAVLGVRAGLTRSGGAARAAR